MIEAIATGLAVGAMMFAALWLSAVIIFPIKTDGDE
jgi:hypothetical protein